ncbi:MAG: hypothetical protein LBT86_07855 [Deltaproteobacteria bacterium]|jgi:hypothetical protein|nr:hypothetical protein [Deltaproteobacteria bacterium]
MKASVSLLTQPESQSNLATDHLRSDYAANQRLVATEYGSFQRSISLSSGYTTSAQTDDSLEALPLDEDSDQLPEDGKEEKTGEKVQRRG